MLFTVTMTVACWQVHAQALVRGEGPTTELIVLLDEQRDPSVLGPEGMVVAVTRGGDDQDALMNRFGRPIFARYLIEHARIAPQERSRRNKDDPEVGLHRLIVMTYASSEDAQAALEKLSSDTGVEYVDVNARIDLQITPLDPEFPVAPAPINYQWAYYTMYVRDGATSTTMNFQGAWDKTRGTAWIGVVDNGIMVGHPDLTAFYKPHFAWNVITNASNPDELSIGIGTQTGHGTHVAGILGATTGFPGVAAGYPAFPAVGVVGGCWFCSGIVIKSAVDGEPVRAVLVAGTYEAIRRGAQVVNMSFGEKISGLNDTDYFDCFDATSPHPFEWCNLLSYADQMDAVLVAASGNDDKELVRMPAFDKRTIAVGALQATPGGSGYRWRDPAPEQSAAQVGSNTGTTMVLNGLVAPGKSIVSTFYTGKSWNRYTEYACSDSNPITSPNLLVYAGSDAPAGYGSCTGTSMATPYVAVIVALMRTANPLLTDDEIKAKLLASGNLQGASALDKQKFGRGVPNALTAVNSVLAVTNNRLTPLFSMKNQFVSDRFYTVAPQQAGSASRGYLPPLKVTGGIPVTNNFEFYGTVMKPGGVTYNLPASPGEFVSPIATRAQMWLFTTHVNPKEPAKELKPLYRLSFRCGDPIPSGRMTTCAANPSHISHFYTADINELLLYSGQHGFRSDGIEGYVYPVNSVKHVGSVSMRRGYKASTDEWALFPESQEAAMVSEGFTQALVTLGYVYEAPASGLRPTL